MTASPTDQMGSTPLSWHHYTRAEQNTDCAIHILGVSAAMGACTMLTVVGKPDVPQKCRRAGSLRCRALCDAGLFSAASITA